MMKLMRSSRDQGLKSQRNLMYTSTNRLSLKKKKKIMFDTNLL